MCPVHPQLFVEVLYEELGLRAGHFTGLGRDAFVEWAGDEGLLLRFAGDVVIGDGGARAEIRVNETRCGVLVDARGGGEGLP